jgi:Fe-Mn family superoxide dismutase
MKTKTTIVGLHNRECIVECEEKLNGQSTNAAVDEKSIGMVAGTKEKFKLPDLPFAYDALEPFIDKITMEIHHDKHHASYVTNLNKALEEMEKVHPTIEDILKNISRCDYTMTVRNNGGGHYNHSMFWKIMKPNGGGQPNGKLLEAINNTFDSFGNFKNKFNEAATKHFGSGWVWLVMKDDILKIGTTQNQDNPLMDISDLKGTPILCLDLWEHAYYLKHQNKRVDYINDWWNIVNWDEATNNLKNAK